MAVYSSHKNDCSKTNTQNDCSFDTKRITQFVLSPLPVVNETENEMCMNVTCEGSPWPIISVTFFMKKIRGKSAYSQSI